MGDHDITKALSKSPSTFFRFNSITKQLFANESLIRKIEAAWKREFIPVLEFATIFPEVLEVSDEEASKLVDKLNIPESKIQDTLRAALRSKGATSIPRRGKDSSLEVADVEHYRMKIAGREATFAAVVKGVDSVKGPRVSLKDISHQVMRAYTTTHPDHILLLSAKEPKDGLISSLTRYGQDVQKPNLVIFVPPLDLTKFLKTCGII
jgi:hypothetical protein